MLHAPALDPHANHAPSTRFLSNGAYRVLITATGTGGSWYRDHALTRWAGDRVEDPDAFSIYLRDLKTGGWSSIGHQPVRRPAERYRATWVPGRFGIEREDNGVHTQLDIAVTPTAPLEMRRLTVANRSPQRTRVELTSYAEVVLSPPAAHAAHPAFSKLFVQTEYVPGHAAILARRRPRTADDKHPWLVHALCGTAVVGYETDRARFLGRGGTPGSPLVLMENLELSGSCGNVLDPIVSLRCVLDLEPGEHRSVGFLLGAADDRDGALLLLADCGDEGALDTAFAAAEAAARRLHAKLGLDTASAAALHALGGAVLYGHPALRPALPPSPQGHRTPAATASARLPLRQPYVVVHADRTEVQAPWRTLMQAHALWRELGLGIEALCIGAPSQQMPAVAHVPRWAGTWHDVPAISPAALAELEAGAHLVVRDELPTLPGPSVRPPVTAFVPAAPLVRLTSPLHAPALVPAATAAAAVHGTTPAAPGATAARTSVAQPAPLPASAHLECANGYGGLAEGGQEYVLRLRGEAGFLHGLPPQAWSNVIANENFGFLVSETGARSTWSQNSRQHRLSPWFNDPLLDPHGEALYVRDDDTGEFWSPLPGPCPAGGDYEVRHGFGVSTFRHASHDLLQETRLFVPRHDPVQMALLRLTNTSRRTRRLSLFAYQRLVLGCLPQDSTATIVTARDPASGALLAQQTLPQEFAGIAFASCVPAPATHVSADRATFVGRNGTPARPAALSDATALDGRTGAALDACFVQQVVIELPPAAARIIGFLFGEAPDRPALQDLLARHATPEAMEAALHEVVTFWRQGLAHVHITTPSRALDLLANGWLPYQTLACRLWARTAAYQSGGAFGYRDQLQDAAALVALWPECTRAQILLHAAHQFVEGDVLHWWHPPHGRGIRTRFADDLLWLPYLTAEYVQATGDWRILDERLPYLTARPLAPAEDEAYLQPQHADADGSLYEHCCRAIDRSLARGEHGLPLFGSGDWNDGMNRVGRAGRGESVWMGFFLYAVLGEFGALCAHCNDGARVQRYHEHRAALRQALEGCGWDGDWYRRGYYDNGNPLGSRQSDECRIDVLVQAWAVLSGAAAPERAARALHAVETHLLSEPDGLIRLLWPPFEHTAEDPGYIKGYVRGVRENGGQYTHAALWFVRALATLGRNDRVAPLLEMLSPLQHARDPEAVARYRVEPYVVAADIYGAAPHVGRGGWTWYTGSAGWMYRLILESLLGFRPCGGDSLQLAPCVPDTWPQFTLDYQWPGETTRWRIVARNPAQRGRGVRTATLDGAPLAGEAGTARIPVRRDGRAHLVELVLGADDGGGA